MSAPKPSWPAHDDDGVWYCDAHGTYDCRRCASPSAPTPTYSARELISRRDRPGLAGSLDMPFFTLAARVEAALAILDRYRPAQTSGSYDAALIVQKIQRALDGRQA